MTWAVKIDGVWREANKGELLALGPPDGNGDRPVTKLGGGLAEFNRLSDETKQEIGYVDFADPGYPPDPLTKQAEKVYDEATEQISYQVDGQPWQQAIDSAAKDARDRVARVESAKQARNAAEMSGFDFNHPDGKVYRASFATKDRNGLAMVITSFENEIALGANEGSLATAFVCQNGTIIPVTVAIIRQLASEMKVVTEAAFQTYVEAVEG